ncbi:hypothetical protein [Niallia nealsonii]|uniref:Uncharacterized protein n=1 Tax=Niallia nealsonii TaxID=115979 RepID=A0A2N0YZD3_9BACI|nr:hypothetical protein [Niallia nealsonii]PKG22608.1 hypothetical protein CWS01_15870 [Niallia nealsonii]
MLHFNNRIFICSTDTNLKGITVGTKFYYSQYDGIVNASFIGRDILMGELVGMVNQQDQLEGIFNFCNYNFEFFSGTFTLTPKKLPNKSYKLHGLWVLSGDETIEHDLILEELLYNV